MSHWTFQSKGSFHFISHRNIHAFHRELALYNSSNRRCSVLSKKIFSGTNHFICTCFSAQMECNSCVVSIHFVSRPPTPIIIVFSSRAYNIRVVLSIGHNQWVADGTRICWRSYCLQLPFAISDILGKLITFTSHILEFSVNLFAVNSYIFLSHHYELEILTGNFVISAVNLNQPVRKFVFFT